MNPDCECRSTHYACTCVRKRMEALERGLERIKQRADSWRAGKSAVVSASFQIHQMGEEARALLPERRAE